MTEIWNLNTLCRCCHADGSFSSLDSTSNVMGATEMFSEILKNTFDISFQSPPISVSKSICNKCIIHLLNGALFKKQVLECEQKFEDYCKNELLQHTPLKIEKDEDDTNFEYEMLIKTPDVDTKTEPQNKEEISSDEEESEKPDNSNFEYEMSIDTPVVDIKTKPHDEEEISTDEETSKSTESKSRKLRVPKENPMKHPCKFCKKSFANIKILRKHMSDDHNTTYACNICNIKFKMREKYDKHSYKHSICKNSTIPLRQMTKFECKSCTKTYDIMSKLIAHANVHTRQNVFICDLCNKDFLYKNILRKHILWHAGLNKQYMCDTCGNSFNDLTNLEIHKRNVHEKLKLFKCNVCSKKFAANRSLKAHMTKHTNEKSFQCDLCAKTFTCTQYLAVHRRNHIQRVNNQKIIKSIDKYICKICKTVFDHRGIYMTHLHSHETIKYICLICNTNFSSKFSLKRHMEIHVKIKKYPCDKCDKKFVSEYKLRCHKRNHDPSRKKEIKTEKIRCDLCKKAFSDIEKHMKTHNNKRHQCEFCDKSYSERNTLHRHVKQCHQGVRHKCDVCGQSYVNTSSLKTHKMKVHNIEVKKCEEELSN